MQEGRLKFKVKLQERGISLELSKIAIRIGYTCEEASLYIPLTSPFENLTELRFLDTP